MLAYAYMRKPTHVCSSDNMGVRENLSCSWVPASLANENAARTLLGLFTPGEVQTRDLIIIIIIIFCVI